MNYAAWRDAHLDMALERYSRETWAGRVGLPVDRGNLEEGCREATLELGRLGRHNPVYEFPPAILVDYLLAFVLKRLGTRGLKRIIEKAVLRMLLEELVGSLLNEDGEIEFGGAPGERLASLAKGAV